MLKEWAVRALHDAAIAFFPCPFPTKTDVPKEIIEVPPKKRMKAEIILPSRQLSSAHLRVIPVLLAQKLLRFSE
jgi:hypothetical protein